ncbi:MAG: selenide, water dikinase SelD [Planctomycetes bacterium]|nr:selenide, water dikinase SelD [Planctomycetota bacterium]
MPIGQLAQVLRGVNATSGGRLLIGPDSFDDAGIVSLAGAPGLPADCDAALVQTIDYFPPVVDDPFWFGQIAAANALSDVYAMGGTPFSALNLAGIPRDFPPEWTAAIFRGGFDKMREAATPVAGGHTVQSNEAFFGFAVTGLVDRRKVAANSGARAGDVVYLTKSLGMGAMTTAAKKQAITWAEMEPAARQMATLNDRAAAAMNAVGAHACTDVTGFGLVGHARNVAKASGVTLRLDLARCPFFPGAIELARRGLCSGGSKRGKAALAEVVRARADLDPALVDLAYDAETSGGLLIVVPAASGAALERELGARGVPAHAIGECAPASDVLIELA